MLCDASFACDLATVDCMMMAEMTHTFAILLESAAERTDQTQYPGEGLGLTIVLVLFCFIEYHSGV